MRVTSGQSAHDVSQFLVNHDNHHLTIKSFSEETGSLFEAELSPQEMRRVLDFIQDLQNKSYTIKA